MRVYIDLVFILNMWLDFLLLFAVAIILKRNLSIKRLIFASLFGGLSTFFLFFNLSQFILIFSKLLICILMILISFSFSNFKSFVENIIYFYLVSIILAGFIYIIRNNYDIGNFKNNFLLLSILTPVILYFYYRNIKRVNNHYNNLYNVKLYYHDNIYNFIAFLDTGNKLYDQYKRRPIILVYSKNIKFDYSEGLLVPYETANAKTVLKCLKADKIVIDNKVVRTNVIFGLVDEKFKIDDVNMILHNDLIGG